MKMPALRICMSRLRIQDTCNVNGIYEVAGLAEIRRGSLIASSNREFESRVLGYLVIDPTRSFGADTSIDYII